MGRNRQRSDQRKQRNTHTQEALPLPEALTRRLTLLLGSELPDLVLALNEPPPVSLRLNPAKGHALEDPAVPWCSTGRYLHERPRFTTDPLLHAGAYYVQEASSMFLEQAWLASGLAGQDILALDLCAAPGGKSTHLRSLLTAGSLLVANEVDGRRRSVLEENLWKWGLPNVVVAGSAARDLQRLPERFDLVLLDAPCSGEGMFRKDPFARQQWTTGLVDQCSSTQRDLLPLAWMALRPGGVLIYSTCTWEPAENELALKILLEQGAEMLDIPLDPQWGIERTDLDGVTGYRCYPHRLRGEGFFMAMLRKPGDLPQRSTGTSAGNDQPELRQWLRHGAEQVLTERDDVLHALHGRWTADLQVLLGAMRITAPGIPVAERKAGKWRPHAALALSTLLAEQPFPLMDMDLDQALQYLRGEALPAPKAEGIALATFQSRPLGWLQGAGNRWNNRWPAPWRIRMQTPS